MKRLLLLMLVLGSFAWMPAQETRLQRAADDAQHPGKGENDMMGWKWANFVVLVAGLGYLGVKLGGPFFRERTAGIRKSLDDADLAKREADARVAEVNAKMANLNAEIEQLKAALREEQGKQAERLRQAAAADIGRIQAQGEQQIEALSKAARQDLRAYSAQLAVELAEQKIRTRLTPELEERLADTFLEKLKA